MNGDFPLLAQMIRERLPLREALTAYGLCFNAAEFAPCPFHGPERTASLKVYPRRWQCFGCHRGGDLVDFVQARFGLGPRQALRRINQDFALGLPWGELPEALHSLAQRRDAARTRREAAAQAYREAYDLWVYWDYLAWLHTPLSPSDVTAAYSRALWALPQAKYALEVAYDRYLQALKNNQGGDCHDSRKPCSPPEAPSQARGGYPVHRVS